jgi:hypothetical protein
MHLTAARIQQANSLPPGGRDSLFSHYGVREAEFERTLAYYSRHPDRLKSMYEAVLDSLNALEERVRYPSRR